MKRALCLGTDLDCTAKTLVSRTQPRVAAEHWKSRSHTWGGCVQNTHTLKVYLVQEGVKHL